MSLENPPVESLMQIVCPNCTTSYQIAGPALGQAGRMVRCVRCTEQWFMHAPEPESAIAGFASIRPHSEDGSRYHEAAADQSEPEYSATGFARAEDEIEFAPPDEVMIGDAPATAPYHEDEYGADRAGGDTGVPSSADPNVAPDFFEIQRRRKARIKSKAQARGAFMTAPRLVAVMVGILIGLFYERVNIVRLMPQTASLYSALGLNINLRGLVFEQVATTADVQDGVPILVIEGAIRNITRDNAEVPRLRFAMRNTAGADIYSWTAVPEKPMLAAGQTMPFRTRLASPPSESRGAYVRFLQRRDIVAAANP